jgi:two-component system response regulator AlgR
MPEPLRVLIVDDEPLARLRLRGLVDELAAQEPRTMVVGEAEDADAALLLLRRQPADVVLLDIRMPGRDGLQLTSALRKLREPPAVIFVTAHAEHALRAFELEAVDYLTKPVRRERLHEALARVRGRRTAWQPVAPPDEPPVLVVTERDRVLRLPLAEVLVLKAGQKYVTVRTTSRSVVIDESLTDLEQRLGTGFLRVHRNALVARHAIRALERRGRDEDDPGSEGWAVRVAPLDEWLAVSRRQLTSVRLALEGRGG